MVFNLATRYDSTPNSELAANHTLYEPVRASQIMFLKVDHGSWLMSCNSSFMLFLLMKYVF